MFGLFGGKDEDEAKDEGAKAPEDRPFVTKYGTLCRSCMIRQDDRLDPEYLVAWQDADTASKWHVKRIAVINLEDEDIVSVRDTRKNLSFLQAITELSAFENGITTLPGETVGETAEELGDAHYRAFAEREGVSFDTDHVPHLPARDGVPPNGRFRQSDLDRTAQAVKAAKDAPRVNHDNGVLSELFNLMAHKGNFTKMMQALDEMELHDTMLQAARDFKSNLAGVISHPTHYKTNINGVIPDTSLRKRDWKRLIKHKWTHDGTYEMNQTAFFTTVSALDRTYETIRKYDKKGIDMKPAMEFLHLCDLAAHLIYAQALFHHACTSVDGDNHADEIRDLQKTAAEIMRKNLDITSEDEIEKTKAMIIQPDRPEIPKFIDEFLSGYSAWRTEVSRAKRHGDFNHDALIEQGRRTMPAARYGK